jgi:hypothetical protein
MSTVRANQFLDAAGGNTAQINGMTPTADSLQGFRNRIINGDMRIDQRNNGASVTPVSAQYVVDRFRYTASQASRVTQQRSTAAPSGFTNSLLTTVATATTAASTDFFGLEQLIEGFNAADLGWGTASAQSVTLSFWVRSSATGTYSLRLTNEASNRSYVATYTISAANTFEYKTVTVPGDTSGTWQTNNAAGITVWWDLGSGSNYNGTAGSWAAGNFTRTSGSVNWIATSSATYHITGVQLEAGSVATPFERRDYGRELMMCQRYYVTNGASTYVTNAGSVFTPFFFKVTMRSTPTVTVTPTGGTVSLGTIGPDGFHATGSAAAGSTVTASAEL